MAFDLTEVDTLIRVTSKIIRQKDRGCYSEHMTSFCFMGK